MDATTSSLAPIQATTHRSTVETDYSHQLIVRGFEELKFRLLFRAMKSGVKNTTILAIGELLDRADEAVWEAFGIMQSKIFVKDLTTILGRGRSCVFAVNRALVDGGLLNRWPSRPGHRPAIYQFIMPGEKVDPTRAQLAWEAADDQSKILDARAQLARADVTPDLHAARAELARADVDRPSRISDARAELARADVTRDPTAARAELARAGVDEQSKNLDARAELARAGVGENPDSAGAPIALSSASSSAEEEGADKGGDAVVEMLRELSVGEPNRSRLAALKTTTERVILAANFERGKRSDNIGLLCWLIEDPSRIARPHLDRADKELARRRRAADPPPPEPGIDAAAVRAELGRLTRDQLVRLLDQVIAAHPARAQRWQTYRDAPLDAPPMVLSLMRLQLCSPPPEPAGQQQGGVAHG